jgi:hypothetical protein
MASRLFLMALAVACAAALAGCGGKKDSAEEQAKEAAAAASAPVCTMTTTVDGAKLPSGFPKPDAVTYHQESTAGPSEVVNGTYAGSLDDAYSAYESAVAAAHYDVLFKEKEDKDAEISYKGGGTTGQIALRDVCGESDKLVVHITNRPQ